MEQLSFKLEKFEGPLDFLLHLISKHKLDIHDIPIGILVDQYMDYINKMSEMNMEITGEFLEMAARLVYIKTVSMFPKNDEAAVLKKELEGQLIELDMCKRVAEIMKTKFIGNNITVRKPMKIEFDNTYSVMHESDILLKFLLNMNAKTAEEPIKTDSFEIIVQKKVVSVTVKILYVLRKLYKSGECMMNNLFSDMTDRSERAATFLAVLELTRSGRIVINDDNTVLSFNKNYSKESAPQAAEPDYS